MLGHYRAMQLTCSLYVYTKISMVDRWKLQLGVNKTFSFHKIEKIIETISSKDVSGLGVQKTATDELLQ